MGQHEFHAMIAKDFAVDFGHSTLSLHTGMERDVGFP